ncbi:YfhO family protein [Streptococcus cameli]
MNYIKQHKQSITLYSLSFLLPATFMAILLAIKGIWWGSETSILASDSFHQYVIFNQTLRNALHGDGSLFYTFTSGLGLNFYALSSYYLGSFLSPLAFFFDLKSMPDFIYLITIVKFGLIGLSTSISLSHIYKKLQFFHVLLLSTSFALMSFSTSQLEINIWLDVFILVPLILLGVDNIVKKKSSLLYFICLTCLFIQNYYFGFMTAIFLAGWIVIQISWNVKNRFKTFFKFTIVSILATLSSMMMLLPTYLDLKTHGETLTKIVNLKTENSWYLDLFAKHLVGNYDTTKFGAIPMISVGLLPLLLTILFFTIKSIKWQVKLTYALFLSFIIASFYIQPLDLFWQGMHAPNMFLHRYAWVFSILLIYMAAETLTRINELNKLTVSIPFLLFGIGFGLTFYFKHQYDFLENIHFIFTLQFLIAYVLILFSYQFKKLPPNIFSLLLFLFSVFEITLHSHYQIEGLSQEWHFPSRSSYNYQLTEIDKLVKYSKKETKEFFRTERLNPQTGNDSMKFHYNGISQFSSIRNRSSSSTLDKLGFRSDGTNLNLRYQNNTIIGDSLFGIRYNLAETNPMKYGFSEKKRINDIAIYENEHVAQLAFLSNGIYKDVKLTNLTLDNQTNLLNQLTGYDLQYYYAINPTKIENATILENRLSVQADKDSDTASIHYSLTVPYSTQLYVSIPNITFINEEHKDVQITVNNVSSKFTLDNTFAFFNIGYFAENQDIEVTISFPNNQQVSFDTPSFYRLDTDAYQVAMDFINSGKTSSKSVRNKVFTSYESEHDTSLLFTIPFDKGWRATLNGQNISIKRFQKGLMKIDVPKGKGKIVLTFIPNGFWIGCICFLSGIVLYLFYYLKIECKYTVKKRLQ